MIILNEYFIHGIQKLLESHRIQGINTMDLWKELEIIVSARADYQCNGLIRFYQIFKQYLSSDDLILSFEEIISQLIEWIHQYDCLNLKVIDRMESCKNFINITINDKFLTELFWKHGIQIFKNGLNQSNLIDSNKKQILIDYSSPNVAKSLHIGHLRSTIIGEALRRLLLTQGHCVLGINHIGDWGTQFGMIINWLKTKLKQMAENSFSESDIIDHVIHSNSNDLMNIYREAKKMFDSDPNFADNSRIQTYLLQQGDPFNTRIWTEICSISSNEYKKIYKMLNVHDLVERGESFYQPLIPGVIELLKSSNLLQEHDGAQIIMLEHWTHPLFIIKSDGGYTYDTTDITALYHRLQLIDMDHVIYVTDIGQKSHFDMCFEVAELMGWTKKQGEEDKKVLTHIGFGLVLGKDGKKLQTRSGEVVKMLDVIDEINQKAIKCVEERASSGTPEAIYYKGMTEETMNTLSQKIGTNTLKYFDFLHTPSSNYKYDPDLMFSFNGNTGVYLMYCYARINGIIEKSSQGIKDLKQVPAFLDKIYQSDISSIKPITKETRKLMIHCINLHSMLEDAVNNLDVNKIVKYLHVLCACFNTFNSQKNGKIIGTPDESKGIGICMITSKIIELLFDVLSLEPVDHI